MVVLNWLALDRWCLGKKDVIHRERLIWGDDQSERTWQNPPEIH